MRFQGFARMLPLRKKRAMLRTSVILTRKIKTGKSKKPDGKDC